MFDTFGDDIGPGDVFLHNDPYTGGTHLNDIAMMFPVFAEGRLVLFPCVRAHWGDVGGTTPGSISGKSTEIFHDGVRLPIVKIASGGELNRGLFDVMMANMRVPRERRGDFMSTWGTCQVAERRIAELFERYGVATVEGAIAELIDRAERRTRQRIEALADREYVYEHYLDPVGADAEPVIAKARIRIEGSDLGVDFTGSSGQTRAAMNAGPAVAATGAFIVLKAFLDPAQPINHGNFRPISITAPEGSFFNARYPASCAGSSEVRHAAISAVLGAMSQAMPERMAGDIKGTSNHIYIGGKDPERPEPFIFYEYPCRRHGRDRRRRRRRCAAQLRGRGFCFHSVGRVDRAREPADRRALRNPARFRRRRAASRRLRPAQGRARAGRRLSALRFVQQEHSPTLRRGGGMAGRAQRIFR